MTDLGDKTVCVVDSGLFLEFAIRLAREGFGRVLYYCDINPAMQRVNEASIGKGFEELTRVQDVWSLRKQVDCFAFPDCSQPILQAALARERFPVWGSRWGVKLEWNRIDFKKKLSALGLPVRDYHVCEGLSELNDYLEDKKDQYVKISRYRGNGETWHWFDQRTCQMKLHEIATEFGPLSDSIRFLVETGFDAVEVGYDGYFAGGEFPNHAFHGMERKDKSYLGAFVAKEDLPEALQTVNDAMAPLLREVGYANFFSTEVRIAEDSIPYFTDPTCRHASPAGECLLEAFDNLPQIVWAGANGELVHPDSNAMYAAQAIIEHDGEAAHWRQVVIPNDIRRWVKLYYAGKIADETYTIAPVGQRHSTIGSVIGLGNTPREALDSLKEHAEALEGQPVTIEVASLAEAIKAIEEDNGEAMTVEAPLPEPQEAL